MVETVAHRRGGEHLDAGGGQLDRQRQSIESDADLGHGSSVLVRDDEARIDARGAVREQGHRFVFSQPLDRRKLPGAGSRQREDGELLFPAEVKGGSAGDEHPSPSLHWAAPPVATTLALEGAICRIAG